jgi:alginate O-acetyltransferase complex protein AlgI
VAHKQGALHLWHGAKWTFVVWGLYHGVLVTAYSASSRYWDALPSSLQMGVTFALVSAGWSLFVFDFGDFALFLRALSGQGGGVSLLSWEHLIILTIAAAACFGPDLERLVTSPSTTVGPALLRGATLAVLLFASFLFLDVSETFI